MDLSGIWNQCNMGRELIMVRKLTIAVLALAALSVLAFTPYISLFVPSRPEVTPATLGATAWWEPSRTNGYATNNSISALSNLTAAGSLYDLSVAVGALSPPTRAGMNGLQALAFDGVNGILGNAAYQTSTFTQHIFMVVAFTNGTAKLFTYGVSTPAFNHQVTAGGGLLQFKAGAGSIVSFSSLALRANKFTVYEMLFQGGGGTITPICYTNFVTTAETGSLAATNMVGLLIGGNGACPASLLSMFTWTNRILTTAQRASAYWYCTNRFGVMP